MNSKLLLCLAIVLIDSLFGCSTTPKHPADLPLCYHNRQYDFTFFLPADWKGYSVLMQEWNAELESADYQKVIGTERGPMIVLRNPRWTPGEPYSDIPILVFTHNQWDAVKPQRLMVGAAGSDYEISHNAKYVFGINSHHNWGELRGWEETGKIVQQNSAAGAPHLYPDNE
jgi:hypothetical protein